MKLKDVFLVFVLLTLIMCVLLIPKKDNDHTNRINSLMLHIAMDQYLMCQNMNLNVKDVYNFLEKHISHTVAYKIFKDGTEVEIDAKRLEFISPDYNNIESIDFVYQYEWHVNLENRDELKIESIVAKINKYYTDIEDLPITDEKRNLLNIFDYKNIVFVGIWQKNNDTIARLFNIDYVDPKTFKMVLVGYNALDIYIHKVDGNIFTFRSEPFLLSHSETVSEKIHSRAKIITVKKNS